MKQAETTDESGTAYYEVIVTGSVTSNGGVQKKIALPFHISKEYTIIKEPKDILDQYEN